MRVIAIKDAKYRSAKKFGTFGRDIATLKNFTSPGNHTSWYAASTTSLSVSIYMPETYTNEIIYQNWGSVFLTENTAKENCDIWMTYNTVTDSKSILGVPAVAWCRSQNIKGKSCDLPNQYQTMCIWACGDKLDELDPTLADYPSMRLGYSTTYGNRINILFSSTERDVYHVRGVNCDGRSDYFYQDCARLAVPILEL